ncbi:glycosyltransferase family 2 protein [Chroogloeocystis siderophila]|jgi:glycosyltransferase involved in cell wall biosynthesis|uniref:Glucosyl transferase n=1 Tax=Chroogloeocystis siderophila 5.2 s.c.1 TaxID=247279 RepID=A0A1U7HC14_9CHRO|nr:glycosyltransferase family 2 protein [Chroogloeocystis siderophila]OKH21126.1 glucosyl transferase [Chroogloeocystis siderophila 5.2 s.c.1]
MKKVSVIIPVYNVEQYVADTINSVLQQSYTNFELIIIDDGSPDKSREICQNFNDPRIKIICQKNRGVAAARNTGIRHSQGEYLAFLDADDLWLPQKLEKHIEHLENSPNVGVSFSRSAFIDEEGKPLKLYQMSKLKDITPLDLLCRTPIGNGSAAVFRREVFAEIKFKNELDGTMEDFYFNEDRNLHPSEDVECWLRIAIQTKWKIEGVAAALTLYRVNPHGFSAQILKKLRSWETLLDKAQAYTPAQSMRQWKAPAMAYQLRHLTRRAVTLEAKSTAIELIHRALFTYWQILIEEPHRTLMTLAAAYSLFLLPRSLHSRLKDVAIKIVGAIQNRTLITEEYQQSV